MSVHMYLEWRNSKCRPGANLCLVGLCGDPLLFQLQLLDLFFDHVGPEISLEVRQSLYTGHVLVFVVLVDILVLAQVGGKKTNKNHKTNTTAAAK